MAKNKVVKLSGSIGTYEVFDERGNKVLEFFFMRTNSSKFGPSCTSTASKDGVTLTLNYAYFSDIKSAAKCGGLQALFC